MKKRTLALLVMLALVLTAVFALVACNNTKTFKVTFYDDTKKLGEVEVKDGENVDLSKITYNVKDGYTFVGWYDSIDCEGDPFDAAKTPIKADTKLFGKWQSNTVAADTRIWVLMGNINKNWDRVTALNEDGEWDIVEGMEDYVLEQAEGKNEYSITLEMRAGGGSKFRFVANLDGDNWAAAAQAGLGSIEGFAKATGVNPVDKNEYTLGSDTEWYGNVKKDDKVIFEGGREYDDPTNMWNIYVTADSEGIYKFTIHTYPGEDDRNYITWEKTGDVEVLEKTHDMFIAGTLGSEGSSNFASDKENVKYVMEQSTDNTDIWTAVINVTEDDYASWADEGTKAAIKIRNDVDGSWYSNDGDNNILLSAGDYYVVYDASDDSVKVEELGYYIVGTLLDGETQVNFSIKADFSPKMVVSEGVASVDLTVADVTASYGWLTEKTLKGTETPAGAIYAIKVVYGSSLGVLNWYGASAADDIVGDGNYYFTAAGDYTVSIDLETKTISVVAATPAE